MADPARPIRLVLAAASQPGPVRLGCHRLAAEPLEHPVKDGGEDLVFWVFLPGGGTGIADLGRLISTTRAMLVDQASSDRL
jgi:hypothetical protein